MEIKTDDSAPFGAKTECGCSANPRTGTGDYDNAIFKTSHASSL